MLLLVVLGTLCTRCHPHHAMDSQCGAGMGNRQCYRIQVRIFLSHELFVALLLGISSEWIVVELALVLLVVGSVWMMMARLIAGFPNQIYTFVLLVPFICRFPYCQVVLVLLLEYFDDRQFGC